LNGGECRPPSNRRRLRSESVQRAELAVYFVSDDPPPALVDRMAFQRSDGDIAATLDAMFHSPEFKASLGVKFKDPAHYAISSVRLAYDDRAILSTGPIQNWLNRLAEGRT
jgi:uncharacterized protein (DUF1800 family)